MPSWAVYYQYDDGSTDFVETYSDSVMAYQRKDELQTEIEADDEADFVRAIVREEP